MTGLLLASAVCATTCALLIVAGRRNRAKGWHGPNRPALADPAEALLEIQDQLRMLESTTHIAIRAIDVRELPSAPSEVAVSASLLNLTLAAGASKAPEPAASGATRPEEPSTHPGVAVPKQFGGV